MVIQNDNILLIIYAPQTFSIFELQRFDLFILSLSSTLQTTPIFSTSQDIYGPILPWNKNPRMLKCQILIYSKKN